MLLAEQPLHRRVGVERALRHRAVDALDLVEHRDDRLAAAVEGRLHLVDGRQVALDRGQGRALRDVGDVGRRVRLEVGRGGDQVLRADHPADPPAGHRVGLGDPVDHHAVVGEVRAEHGQRAGLHAVVHEVLVDLVGERPQVVVLDPLADRADLVGRVDRAGRVGRRDEEQHLGALGAGRLELLDGDLVALGLVGEHRHGHAAGELDRLGVRRPVRRRHDHLVAGVDHRRERAVDRLLAAVGDHHLARLDGVPAVAQRLLGDRLLELGQAAGGRVAVVLRVAAGLDRGLDDVVGGREVRLAGPEADHRAALGLERLRLGVDLERGRLGDGADPLGDSTVTRRSHGSMLGVGRGAAGPRLRGRFGRAFPAPRRLPHWWSPTGSGLPIGASPEGTSSTGRASVSKTEGWGFKSLVPCK